MTTALRGTRRSLAGLILAALAAASLVGCARLGGRQADLRRQAPSPGGASWGEIVSLRHALAASPDDIELRLRLADLLVDTGDHRGAERSYREVLEREPENTRAVNNLADLYSRTGWHLDWALERMKPLAARESVHRHVYLDTLGSVYLRLRRWGDARDAFRKASDLCRRGTVVASREECRLIEEHLAQARSRTRDQEPPASP